MTICDNYFVQKVSFFYKTAWMFVVTVLCALKALDIENFGQDIEKD